MTRLGIAVVGFAVGLVLGWTVARWLDVGVPPRAVEQVAV